LLNLGQSVEHWDWCDLKGFALPRASTGSARTGVVLFMGWYDMTACFDRLSTNGGCLVYGLVRCDRVLRRAQHERGLTCIWVGTI